MLVHYTLNNNSDKLDDYIDYIDLYNFVKNSFNKKRFNLLEALASNIINDISKEYSSVFYIKINIRKPSINIDGNKDFINIETEYTK